MFRSPMLRHALAGAALCGAGAAPAQAAVTPEQVVAHYADLAHVMFLDAHAAALALQDEVQAFLAEPNELTHAATKLAWIRARAPYSRTEVFRFGNPNVDDWEGRVNAWPLDEGLIDYVAAGYEPVQGNPLARENVINSQQPISSDLIRSLHEAGGSEANVATGYHAIEFLLWGQDLNEPPGAAGRRPHTDYLDDDRCTQPPCDRRRAFLRTATALLVSDLETMVDDWAPDSDNYRAMFLDLPVAAALERILTGLTELAQAELTGERIRVALLASSQEDEQSCFSDNTHNDIEDNVEGLITVLSGQYPGDKGVALVGPSLAGLIQAASMDDYDAVRDEFLRVRLAAGRIVERAKRGEPFDQQIRADNPAGRKRLEALIAALGDFAGRLERVVRDNALIAVAPAAEGIARAPDRDTSVPAGVPQAR